MKTDTFSFGVTADGQAVTAYRLENAAGAALTVIDYGATVQALTVPNGQGGFTDVVLGYDTVAEYEAGECYIGGTIGRVANRIGKAGFSLNGVTYPLAKNDGENHLHGGVRGFHKQMWQGKFADNALVFSRLSPDGEEGYPGNVQVTVTFRLDDLLGTNALSIRYAAKTDKDTPVCLTNHSYFNLNGGGSVLDHELQVLAERFCENDRGGLPTGRLLDVEGTRTPFDFRVSKAIGRDIHADHEQLTMFGGYDHNFVLAGEQAAVLYSPESSIEMIVLTDMPGMQVYTSNALTPARGKGGRPMGVHSAVCLETQLHPNGMQYYGFPSPILRAGHRLHSETIYEFKVRT